MMIGRVAANARDKALGWLRLGWWMTLSLPAGLRYLCRRYTYRGRHRDSAEQLDFSQWDLDRASAGGW
jgi:hypothetical protein